MCCIIYYIKDFASIDLFLESWWTFTNLAAVLRFSCVITVHRCYWSYRKGNKHTLNWFAYIHVFRYGGTFQLCILIIAWFRSVSMVIVYIFCIYPRNAARNFLRFNSIDWYVAYIFCMCMYLRNAARNLVFSFAIGYKILEEMFNLEFPFPAELKSSNLIVLELDQRL